MAANLERVAESLETVNITIRNALRNGATIDQLVAVMNTQLSLYSDLEARLHDISPYPNPPRVEVKK